MERGHVKSSNIEGGNKSIHHKSHHNEKHDRQNDSQVAKQGKNDGAIQTKRHEAPAYQSWVSERSVGSFPAKVDREGIKTNLKERYFDRCNAQVFEGGPRARRL